MIQGYQIQVNREDILDGNHHPRGCPVARAVTRATGLPCYVTPHRLTISGQTIDLSDDVREWVDAFDAIESVKPLKFELELEI